MIFVPQLESRVHTVGRWNLYCKTKHGYPRSLLMTGVWRKDRRHPVRDFCGVRIDVAIVAESQNVIHAILQHLVGLSGLANKCLTGPLAIPISVAVAA